MAFEKISDQVRALIRENDPRAAADLLAQAFRDKNPQLFNIALVQQANIKKLADQGAAGILSPDEMNREQAKINVALLHLSDEHARLFEGSAAGAGVHRWVFLAGIVVLSLILIGLLLKYVVSNSHSASTFDVEVRLHEPGGDQKVISEGQVNLRLGDNMPQEPRSLDAEGKALFRDLSGKYKGDSVHLVYFPANKDRRFTISKPSATTLTGQNQSIHFTIEFLPDTTVLAATLRDIKGHTVAGAQITIDGNLHATSDANGYFQIAVPKSSGSVADFVIEKNGARLFSGDLTIWAGHKPFPLQ